MGCGKSKETNVEGDDEEEANNPANIHFDPDGNLRHGGNIHDRDDEMHKILSADDATEEHGKLWYVIDDAWMTAWLEFVSMGKGISPAPGPIQNRNLLAPNYEKNCFEARVGLIMSKKDVKGHYKRVNKEQWDFFIDFYPDSGPEIKMYFKEDPKHMDDCVYDTSNWIIDQSGFTSFVEENPPPKKKGNIEPSPADFRGEDTELGVALPIKASLGEYQPVGRMEDNTITDEQRKNLSIFLGGLSVEEPVQTSRGETHLDSKKNIKPERNPKTVTSDAWLFGAPPQ